MINSMINSFLEHCLFCDDGGSSNDRRTVQCSCVQLRLSLFDISLLACSFKICGIIVVGFKTDMWPAECDDVGKGSSFPFKESDQKKT